MVSLKFTEISVKCEISMILFSRVNGDVWNLFLQKCLSNSPLCFIWYLSKFLNLIACQGDKKSK